MNHEVIMMMGLGGLSLLCVRVGGAGFIPCIVECDTE